MKDHKVTLSHRAVLALATILNDQNNLQVPISLVEGLADAREALRVALEEIRNEKDK